MALLPKDLQRFQIDGPNVTPMYIKPTSSVSQIVEQILDNFRYSVDDTYGNLCDALEPLCLQSQRHRLIKGLIHILESRLKFDEMGSLDPVDLREKLFLRAGSLDAAQFTSMTWRQKLMEETAQEFGLTVSELEKGFYSDLKEERRIQSFEDIDAESLIAEYNLTLAKSLLLYARQLTFTLELGPSSAQSLRRLFHRLRFFNLLFESQPITETIWQFKVDGPTAVLVQPQKYASSMAAFLPSLYAFNAWHATSELDIDGKKCVWQLKPDDFEAPIMHFPDRIPEEAEQLSERIVQLAPEWSISSDYPVIDCGGQSVWVSDFSMISNGRVAHVEVLGFWRADYLNRRIESLKKAPRNLILVVSDKLKLDDMTLQSRGMTLIPYKRTPKPQDVIKAAESCALKERKK